MKILKVATAVLFLLMIGAISCSNEPVRVQTSQPPQEQGSKGPAGTFLAELPPTPPGIDPISGRPVIAAPQGLQITQSQTYGTPPLQEFEPKMSEGYPYLAELPAGAEGKVQIAYNYVVEYAGRYRVDLQVTNLSNQPLEGFYYDLALKDSLGNVLDEVRDNGHHNAPPNFPLQPGNSVVVDIGRVSFNGSFGSSVIDTWKVEIEVTYLKLN